MNWLTSQSFLRVLPMFRLWTIPKPGLQLQRNLAQLMCFSDRSNLGREQSTAAYYFNPNLINKIACSHYSTRTNNAYGDGANDGQTTEPVQEADEEGTSQSDFKMTNLMYQSLQLEGEALKALWSRWAEEYTGHYPWIPKFLCILAEKNDGEAQDDLNGLKRVQVARDFMKFMSTYQEHADTLQERAVTIQYAMLLLLDPKNEEEALHLVDNAMATYPLPVLDQPLCEMLCDFYLRTREWQRAVSLALEYSKYGRSTVMRTFKVQDEALRVGNHKLSCLLSTFQKSPYLLRTDVFKSAMMYDPSFTSTYIRSLLDTWPSFTLLNKGATDIVNFFKEEGKSLGSAQLSFIQRGVCRSCGHTMRPYQLSDDEFERLRLYIRQHLFKNKDLFQMSTPRELGKFQKLVDNIHGKYDVVVDGSNFIYRRKNKQKNNIEDLIKDFDELQKVGERVLVISRRHLQWHLRYLPQNIDVFLVDDLTIDDPFFLCAALACGPDTYYVSGDIFRNLIHKLPRELKEIFLSWQIGRQIGYSLSMHTLTPVGCDMRGQEDSGGWHIPVSPPIETARQNPFTNSTLCLRLNNRKE